MKVICPEYDEEFEFPSNFESNESQPETVEGVFKLLEKCVCGKSADKAVYRYLKTYATLQKDSNLAHYFLRALHGEEDDT